jgi:hypothetical protein
VVPFNEEISEREAGYNGLGKQTPWQAQEREDGMS